MSPYNLAFLPIVLFRCNWLHFYVLDNRHILTYFLLFYFAAPSSPINSGYISCFIATSERHHRFGRKETERNVCCQIPKEDCLRREKTIWNWHRTRRGMWSLHGGERKSCATKLLPWYVFEVLQRLVRFLDCDSIIYFIFPYSLDLIVMHD